MSLLREKKKKQLADAMKEAGIGKGIAGAISNETVNKVKKVASDIGKNLSSARTGNLSSKVEGLKKAESKALSNDGLVEQQVTKRYEKSGLSPIYSKGNFSSNSKTNEEKIGSRLTEDDKIPSTSKKRGRRQY